VISQCTLLAVCAVCAALVVTVSVARAEHVPVPPAPTAWVTDTAGLLDPHTVVDLNQTLAAYNRATGHQVIVWIGTTTGDTPLEEWTINAFTAWKVGRKGLDDGAALFIFTRDHKVRIEVGYGLESVLSDAVCFQIERKDLIPNLRAGKPDEAVSLAVRDILAVVGGPSSGPAAQPATPAQSLNPFEYLTIAVIVILLLFVLGRMSRVGRWGPYVIGSGWQGPIGFWGGGFGGGFGGFGGGGGFGGFSGGGGMGGGGGASASW
jgi:uncharacterized protein